MDLLSNMMNTLRLNASVFLHSHFCDNWAVDTSGSNKATFHVIAGGSCWLHIPGQDDAIALQTGDLVVFPHDARHTIANSSFYPPDNVPRNQPAGDVVSDTSTALICGYFEFMENSWNPLLDALPEFIVIHSEKTSKTAFMDSLISFIIRETESGSSGADVVIDRLSDILFIQVIRSYIQNMQQDHGFLAAIADPKISQALSQFHLSPGNDWSVQTLADEANMSRSAFAEIFNRLVSMSPMQYVTRWRMQHAYDLLISTQLSTAQIAEGCGYKSEASFSKVFKKEFDKGPGAVRREAKNSDA